MKERRPILLQGAMKEEITAIKEQLEEIKEEQISGYTFYIGKLQNYPVILSKTDIGLINVTTATILAISKWNPKIIINQGVAGGIDKNVHRGDIIIGNCCININSYQTPRKEEEQGSNSLEWELKTFQEGQDELRIIKANKELLELSKSIEKDLKGKRVIEATIGSGDVWNEEKDRLKWLNEKYKIMCEDMESIAIYQIGERFNLPVIGIRALSNNVRLGEDYDRTVAIDAQKYALGLTRKWIQVQMEKEEQCK